jgi:uncharacterized membrane protein
MASLSSRIGIYPSIQWATFGWAFFLGENAILSENRTWIIDQLGDENYHLFYGLISTSACASIGYGYYKLRNNKVIIPPNLIIWKRVPPIPAAVGAWACMSMGLLLASQTLPKFQIPVATENKRLQVRCPFDFTGNKDQDAALMYGSERITRHPGLWSLGLIGLGQSLVATSIPMRLWWTGPSMVAWMGGSHTDSRYRRGMGGSMDPAFDSQTSNIPFWALICGKQGSGSWGALWNEQKELNTAAAIAASTIWILRKVR